MSARGTSGFGWRNIVLIWVRRSRVPIRKVTDSRPIADCHHQLAAWGDLENQPARSAAGRPPITRPATAIIWLDRPCASLKRPEQEAGGKGDDDGHRHHEFGGIDGSDHVTRIGTRPDQARRDDRSPAATADGIEKSAQAAHRRDEPAGDGARLPSPPRRAG